MSAFPQGFMLDMHCILRPFETFGEEKACTAAVLHDVCHSEEHSSGELRNSLFLGHEVLGSAKASGLQGQGSI